jgi:hypothetical protein
MKNQIDFHVLNGYSAGMFLSDTWLRKAQEITNSFDKYFQVVYVRIHRRISLWTTVLRFHYLEDPTWGRNGGAVYFDFEHAERPCAGQDISSLILKKIMLVVKKLFAI